MVPDFGVGVPKTSYCLLCAVVDSAYTIPWRFGADCSILIFTQTHLHGQSGTRIIHGNELPDSLVEVCGDCRDSVLQFLVVERRAPFPGRSLT